MNVLLTCTALLAAACAVSPPQDGDRDGKQGRQKAATEQDPKPIPLPTEKDLGKRAYAHVAKIVGFGPRTPGSEARKRAADYICARLRALGLKPIRESWTDKKEKISFENVRVRLAGRSRKTLIIGTHYDTKIELIAQRPEGAKPFTGANDGGSGTGLLLAMIEDLVALKTRRPTLEFVWFDGEESIPPEWDIGRALFGSREFVRRHLKKDHTYGALVLLDMVGDKNLAIDRDEESSKELFPPIEAAVKKLGYGKYFFQNNTAVDDDHVPFLRAKLPAIDLIQFENNPHWHEHTDTMEIISPRSLAIVGRVVFEALPAIEKQFLR